MTLGGWNFDNSYTRLPSVLFERVLPTPVEGPSLALFNNALAKELGLDGTVLNSPASASFFTGNTIPPGAEPIAQAYSGHQFGYFTSLGDGRAILLGEQLTPGGDRFDIQLKGAGKTRYSRRGDGRAALGPMIREYIVSEAMHALGIPTTRSLAVALTGEPVYREVPLQGAILTRVAASHIRVGTFEFASQGGDIEVLRALADYTISRHIPEISEVPERYEAWLYEVIRRQAHLVAKWLAVGFVHGVMNTDNMALSGETIDYGPCAFLDEFKADQVFSSIDREGRYAYRNQPPIAQWNLARFAEALLPLLSPHKDTAVRIATEAIQSFTHLFKDAWLTEMRGKVGIIDPRETDEAFIEELLALMQESQYDYTNTFSALSFEHLSSSERHLLNTPREDDLRFHAWVTRWDERTASNEAERQERTLRLRRLNPSVIPRNHLVERALRAAEDGGDLSFAKNLVTTLQNPFNTNVSIELRKPPSSGERVCATFCGT